jgi:hypothetical protein
MLTVVVVSTLVVVVLSTDEVILKPAESEDPRLALGCQFEKGQTFFEVSSYRIMTLINLTSVMNILNSPLRMKTKESNLTSAFWIIGIIHQKILELCRPVKS